MAWHECAVRYLLLWMIGPPNNNNNKRQVHSNELIRDLTNHYPTVVVPVQYKEAYYILSMPPIELLSTTTTLTNRECRIDGNDNVDYGNYIKLTIESIM